MHRGVCPDMQHRPARMGLLAAECDSPLLLPQGAQRATAARGPGDRPGGLHRAPAGVPGRRRRWPAPKGQPAHAGALCAARPHVVSARKCAAAAATCCTSATTSALAAPISALPMHLPPQAGVWCRRRALLHALLRGPRPPRRLPLRGRLLDGRAAARAGGGAAPRWAWPMPMHACLCCFRQSAQAEMHARTPPVSAT